MKSLPKIGRPKRDPINGGSIETSGFWAPAMKRIGKNLVKRGAMTQKDWDSFSGPNGPWILLKGYACYPEKFFEERHTISAAENRKWFCEMIVRRPTAIPLFFALIREEIQRTPEVERWLFYTNSRATHTSAELSKHYERRSGKAISVRQMEQATENVYRRIKKSEAAFPASDRKKSGKR